MFEYYSRNTYLRQLDSDEIPSEKKVVEQTQINTLQRAMTGIKQDAIINEVKNIHISSDHQRAYVFSLSWMKQDESAVEDVLPKRSLWLQVYSLASAWASTSTLTGE